MRIKIIFFFLLFSSTISNHNIQIHKTYKPEINPFCLSQKLIALKIIEFQIKEPVMVFQQIMWETGHLKSKLAVNHYNLFGMKKASYEQNYDKVLKNRDLSYKESGWINSIKDYKEYQSRNGTSLKRYSANWHNYKKRISQVKIKEEILLILKN